MRIPFLSAVFVVFASLAHANGIIGENDLRLLPDDELDPATVLIIVDNEDDYRVCSGTVVIDAVVLTSAHCVFDAVNYTVREGILIIPQAHDRNYSQPMGHYFADLVYVPHDFVREVAANGYSPDATVDDLAVIMVFDIEGNRTFDEVTTGRGLLPWTALAHQAPLTVTGYPATGAIAEPGSMYVQSGCHYAGSALPAGHTCDAPGGLTGAGLVATSPDTGNPVVTGVIAYGRFAMSGDNRAAPLTSVQIGEIVDIAEGFGYDMEYFQPFLADDALYGRISYRNDCGQTVGIATRYMDGSGNWRITPYREFPAGHTGIINVENFAEEFYYTAFTPNDTWVWEGPHRFSQDGEVFEMRRVTRDPFSVARVSISC